MTGHCPARNPLAPALELWAYCGLAACLMLLGVHYWPRRVYAAAFGPDDLRTWVEAICAAVGTVTATINAVAIAIHRWDRRPRKPRRRPRKKEAAEKPGP